MERRVVNQLAAAYEQQVIARGSLVHLVVETDDTGTPAVKLHVSGNKSKHLKHTRQIMRTTL